MNANAADIIGACITGERWMAKDTGQKRPAREAVARLAYHLYELRGRQDGHDIDDWIRAEHQLARRPWSLQARGIGSLHSVNGGAT